MLSFLVPALILLPISASAAIVRDSSGGLNTTSWGTSVQNPSWTHSGGAGLSNTCGIVIYADPFGNPSGGTPSSVTWGAKTMTLATTTTYHSSDIAYIYYAVGVPSGTQTITINRPSNVNFAMGASALYTGCSQTGQPDSIGSGSFSSSPQSQATTTVVASNSWLVGVLYTGGGTATAGAQTNIVQGTGATAILIDSNGIVGTGVQSMVARFTSNSGGMDLISLAPYVAPSNPNPFWPFFFSFLDTVDSIRKYG